MSISLITLGSLETDELATTIKESLNFSRRIIDQWVFVLRSSNEVYGFNSYLFSHGITLDDFVVSISFCNSGISASMNTGVKLVQSDFTLVVHTGDSLCDLDDKSYAYIEAVLDSDDALNCMHVFGTFFKSRDSHFFKTNHCKKRNFFSFLIPWIPHESTIVPTHFYSKKLYDTSFRSAMDYDFFIYFYLLRVTFKTYPLYFTNFSLGGTSSDLLISSMEIRRSLILNNFCGINLLSTFASTVLILFVYIVKSLFKYRAKFSLIFK